MKKKMFWMKGKRLYFLLFLSLVVHWNARAQDYNPGFNYPIPSVEEPWAIPSWDDEITSQENPILKAAEKPEDWIDGGHGLGQDTPIGDNFTLLLVFSILYLLLISRKIMKKIYSSMSSKMQILLLMLLFSAGASAADYAITPLQDPSTIVPGMPVQFSVNFESSPQINDASFVVKLPTGWSATSVQQASGGTATMSTSEITVSYSAAISGLKQIIYTVTPSCAVPAGGKMSYELKTGSTVLLSSSTGVLGNFNQVVIVGTIPGTALLAKKDVETTRKWNFSISTMGVVVKTLKMRTKCDRSKLTISKLELVDALGNLIPSGGIPLTSETDGYSFELDINAFTKAGYPNGIGYKEEVYLKETIMALSCDATVATEYSALEYSGNGSDFCTISSEYVKIGTAQLALDNPAYSGKVTIDKIEYPFGANKGIIYITANNTSHDVLAKLRDVLVPLYIGRMQSNQNVGNYDTPVSYGNVYLVRSDNNKLDLTAIAGCVEKTAHPAYSFLSVNFSKLGSANDASSYGLSDLDGDGITDDLASNSKLNLQIEFDYIYTGAAYVRGLGEDCCSYGLPKFSYYTAMECLPECGPKKTYDILSSTDGITTKSFAATVSPFIFEGVANGLLSVTDQISFGAYKTYVSDGKYTVYVKITLPVGLEIDDSSPANTVYLKKSGVFQPVAFDEIIMSGGKKTGVVFKLTSDALTSGAAEYQIKVISNSDVPELVKNVKIEHLFDHGDASNKSTFGCYTSRIMFNKRIGSCPDPFTPVDFSVERTSFGWTNSSKTTRMSKALGANVLAAGPFDNVEIKLTEECLSQQAIDATNTLKMFFQYKGGNPDPTKPYFQLSPTYTGTLKVSDSGGTERGSHPINLSDVIIAYNTTTQIYSYTIDLAPYLTAASLSTFNLGDKIEVTLYAQTTQDLPYVPTQVNDVYSGLLFNDQISCTGFESPFTLWDYGFKELSPGYKGNYNENSGRNSTDLLEILRLATRTNDAFYTLFSGAGEYRPNTFIDLTCTSDPLYKIDGSVKLYGGIHNASEVYSKSSVTYNDSKTTFSLTDVGEEAANWYLAVNAKVLMTCLDKYTYQSSNAPWMHAQAKVRNYESSAAPQEQVLSSNSDRFTYTEFKNYTFDLTTDAPRKLPTTNEVSWNFNLRNTSSWVNTDPLLPNSWMAFELPAGTSLKEVVILGTTYLQSDLIEYGGVNSGKYWIKLGDVSLTNPTEVKLTCNYNICDENYHVINVRYGVSNGDYPTDPYNGYSNYNAQGRLCNDFSLSLDFKPATASFVGTMNLMGADNDGKFPFCSPINVESSFVSQYSTDSYGLKFEMTLPINSVYIDGSMQMRIGSTGSLQAVDGTINYNSVTRTLSVVLSDNVKLGAYGSPDDEITLSYSIMTECNFFSGNKLYGKFEAKSPCNSVMISNTSSQRLRISGLVSIPRHFEVLINEFSTSNLYGSGGGIVTVKGSYRLLDAGLTQSYDYILIELPPNLKLKSGSVKNPDGIVVPMEGQVGIVKGIMGDGFENTELFEFELQLEPTSATAVNCTDEHSIVFNWGTAAKLFCDKTGVECDVYELGESTVNRIATFNKMDAGITEILSAAGTFSSTTPKREQIVITGKVFNNSTAPGDINLTVLYDQNGNGYDDSDALATGENVAFQVTGVPAGGTKEFTQTITVDPVQACRLIVASRNTSNRNPYFCQTTSALMGTPSYTLTVPSVIACQGVEITVGDPDLGYNYSWTGGGNYLSARNIAQPTFKYTDSQVSNQVYELHVNRGSAGCQEVSTSLSVSVTALESNWNGTTTDWNTASNWTNGVPSKCTNVIILDNATAYPILTAATEAKCANIHFQHGGEVVRTDLLDYDDASYEITLNSNRWYTLSSALQDMYSGDYILAENRSIPVYMMQYQAVNPETLKNAAENLAGNWSKVFHTTNVLLTPGLGYSIFPSSDDNQVRFSFPKTATEYQYYDENPPYAPIPGKKDVGLVRTNAYKLFDQTQFNVSVDGSAQYSTMLVGNPFMSHLDFSAFRNEQLDGSSNHLLNNEYYVWSDGGTSFESFNPAGKYSTNPTGTGVYIAPLQSFIVRKVVATNPIASFKMNAATMSVSLPGVKLRSENSLNDQLNIEVLKKGKRNSAITLAYEEGVSNAFKDGKDMHTLFSSNVKKSAVLYALADGKATSIRVVGDLSQSIPLGIRTTESDSLEIRVNGLESFDPSRSIYLVDNYGSFPVVQDLRKNPVYKFYLEAEADEHITDRFTLRMDNQTTSLDNLKSSGIIISQEANQIIVGSSQDNLIQKVELINLQGQYIQVLDHLNQARVVIEKPVSSQVVVIRVSTDHSSVTEKLIIK